MVRIKMKIVQAKNYIHSPSYSTESSFTLLAKCLKDYKLIQCFPRCLAINPIENVCAAIKRAMRIGSENNTESKKIFAKEKKMLKVTLKSIQQNR